MTPHSMVPEGAAGVGAGALQGVKIVSMAEQFPGPFCTMILTDMGADVIQVERPRSGDPARFVPPFYEALNRGKRSISLDITEAADLSRLLTLVKSADVFLEGFRPGRLDAYGLGYAALSNVNPRLIYCSISGFGQSGPYRDRPAHDITYQGIGGALAERLRDDVPGKPSSLLLGDAAAGLYAAIGVLAALYGRNATGKGTYIDIAITDAVTSTLTPMIAMSDQECPPPPWAEPAYDMFRCADGLALTLSIAHEDTYWQKLCDVLGLVELRGWTRSKRVGHRADIHAQISGIIARQARAYWERIFDATGQMWGPVNSLLDLPNDPQLRERNMLQRLSRHDGHEQWVVRQPIKFSAYANAPLVGAPVLDQGERMGMGEALLE